MTAKPVSVVFSIDSLLLRFSEFFALFRELFEMLTAEFHQTKGSRRGKSKERERMKDEEEEKEQSEKEQLRIK